MIFSYTFLSNWENCPRKAYHLYIAKDLPKEAPSEALILGRKTHEAFENRLKNEKPLPTGFEQWEKYCTPLENLDLRVEGSWGITREGRATGFFDENVWFRGKADVTVLFAPSALILDWKTGKKREDPDELEIFGLLLRAREPKIEKVVGRYVWLKEDKLGQEHDLSQAGEKFEQLQRRTRVIDDAVKAEFFPPRQNPLCNWCSVKSCEFNPRKT